MTDSQAINTMNPAERSVLAKAIGSQAPRLMLRSSTKVDTGRWWNPSRLWLCVHDQEILLLAASRREHLESIPLRECIKSHYCHTNGVLVLEPAEQLRFSRIALAPADALSVLHLIEQGQTTNPTTNTSHATENTRA